MHHYATPQPDQQIHQHPHLWCNGRIINIEDFGFPAPTHGFHYGTTMFGGTGVRLCADEKHRIFRAQDHVRRILDHAQGFGLQVPFSAEEILDACVKISQLNMFRLTTEDLYLRMCLDPSDQQLGVGSSDKADFIIFSQDLTQYLKIAEGRTGASLLYPGPGLFRRGDETTSLSFFKNASNYGIGNLWKRIAKIFGAVETLATFNDGADFISETTGACIFIINHDGTIDTPNLECMCLDSITRKTIIWMLKKIGYTVRETYLTDRHLLDAAGVFLVGTWAGPVFIEEVLYDDNVSHIPKHISTNDNGREFFQWIVNNLNPKPYRYSTNCPAYQTFRKIEAVYWNIVRCNFQGLASGLPVPESWHTLVPQNT